MLSALLDAASSSVRDAAGSPISRGTWTITWPGQPGQWTTVPIQPVVSVQNVQLDGVDVADCKLVGGRVWRWAGWADGCESAEIAATVTGRLDPGPRGIVDLGCGIGGSARVRSRS